MKKILFILMLIPSLAFAQDYNEKYSFRDFTHQKFTDIDASEFNNTTIDSSCFYQESLYSSDALSVTPPSPMVDVFPSGMTGVVFKECNLDNVNVPAGNIIIDGTHKKIRVCNDAEDWILDVDNKPLEPMDKEQRIEAGVWYLPKDIPDKQWTEQERKDFEDSIDNALSAISP